MYRDGQKNHNRWLGAVAILVALIIWEVIAAGIIRNPFILPSPVDVFFAFINLLSKGRLLLDFEASLIHFGIGLIAALLIGIPIGIVMGWSRRFDAFLDPVIEILRPIPPLAWIPFAIIWFGLTSWSAGFVIFIGAVFPVIINTYSGFRGVPRIFVEAGKMLGCTKNLDLIRYIAFPAALPSVAAGIRIAIGGMDVSCCCGTVRGIKQRAWHGPLVLLQPPPDGLRGCLYDTPWPVRAFLRYGVPVLYRPALPQMADRGGGVKWGTSRYGT